MADVRSDSAGDCDELHPRDQDRWHLEPLPNPGTRSRGWSQSIRTPMGRRGEYSSAVARKRFFNRYFDLAAPGTKIM